MARTAEHEKKLAEVKSAAAPITPFDQTKSYCALIQEYGLIVRKNKANRNSQEAQKFLLEHPDFNKSLQLVSILEHFRGARFNIQYAQSTEPDPVAESVPIPEATIIEATAESSAVVS